MEVKRTQAYKGMVGGHEVVIVKGEFQEWLLIVNGKSLGYVKPDYMEKAIKEATRYPRLHGVVGR